MEGIQMKKEPDLKVVSDTGTIITMQDRERRQRAAKIADLYCDKNGGSPAPSAEQARRSGCVGR
jgi:hypothetical protein